jgi:hypothetical protein
MLDSELTRRTFARLLGGALASSTGIVLPRMRYATTFACVASRNKVSGGLHLFSIESNCWTRVDFLPVRAPSALASLPDGRGLVVANAVSEFHHRPSGYVESYVLNRNSGRLTLAGRCGLTLSATAPESLAISDCGRYLAVLAGAGSVLNVLTLSNYGILGPPLLVRKQITDPALAAGNCPRGRLAFDAEGALLWLDGYSGRVTRLPLDDQDPTGTELCQTRGSDHLDRGVLRKINDSSRANSKFEDVQIDRTTGHAYILDQGTGRIFCMKGPNGAREQVTDVSVSGASALILL